MLPRLRFLWLAGRGWRLRPWRSPYLRWRVETFTGIEAERVGAREMLRVIWRYRGRLLAFLWWCGSMERWRRLSRHPVQSAHAGPND